MCSKGKFCRAAHTGVMCHLCKYVFLCVHAEDAVGVSTLACLGAHIHVCVCVCIGYPHVGMREHVCARGHALHVPVWGNHEEVPGRSSVSWA